MNYDAVDNADSQQTGTFQFKVTPNYSGTPATAQYFVATCKSDSDTANLVRIYHANITGDITIQIKNGSDADIIPITTLGAWVPVSGVEYEFEFNFDITTGATRLFIDGVQFGSTMSQTGTRSGDINHVRVGSHPTLLFTSNFKFDDLIFYSTVQHTGNYTPGQAIQQFNYLESKTDTPAFTYSGSGALQALISFLATLTGTAATFTINDKWANGSFTWSASDGTISQTMSLANVQAFLVGSPGLEIVDTYTVQIWWPDSNGAAGTIDNLILNYTGQQLTFGTLVSTSTFTSNELTGFSSVEGLAGSDTAKYGIEVNGLTKYWDGSAWVTSDLTLGQLNTKAEIVANISSLISLASTVRK